MTLEELKVEADKLGYKLTPKKPLEELKTEANEQGYALVKRQTYYPFPTCKCTNYKKGVMRFRDSVGYYYHCPICGLTSKSTKYARDADRVWYELTMEKFGRGEVKRR